MASIVHSTAAILALLERGLSPITDNKDALVELGFERAYPQVRRGHESTIWERSIMLTRRSLDSSRVIARERAFLVTDGGAATDGFDAEIGGQPIT